MKKTFPKSYKMALLDLTRSAQKNDPETETCDADAQTAEETEEVEAPETEEGYVQTEEPTSPEVTFRSAPTPETSDEGLAKLRDIVFGDRFHSFQYEVSRVEKRLTDEVTALRDEIRGFGRRLEEKITELDARTTKGDGELRDQMLSQSNVLADAIQERTQHAIKLAEDGLAELRETKLERTVLSSFLVDLASELNQDKA